MASVASPCSKARKLAKKNKKANASKVKNNRKEKTQGGTHDVKLSKMLSRLLRHRPQGLVMQPDGYVRVSKLLQLDGFKRYEVADIVRVVEANDKQRFSLIHAGKNMMVRANQGHTLKTVDQEQLLTRINDPSEVPCCIHGTYFTSWELIKTSGLDKMQRNHVHCAMGSPEEECVISGMRASCEVVIHIDVRRAMEEGGLVFYRSLNNVILTEGPILPKYFLKCVRRSDSVNLMNNEGVSGVSKGAAPAQASLFDDSWMDEIGVHPKDGFGTYKDDDLVLEKERVEKEEKEMSGVSGGATKIGQQQQQVGLGRKRKKKKKGKQRGKLKAPLRIRVEGTTVAYDGVYQLVDTFNNKNRWNKEGTDYFVYFEPNDRHWAVGNHIDVTWIESSNLHNFDHPLGLTWVPKGVQVKLEPT